MSKSFSLKELADITGCSFYGDPDARFIGFDDLQSASFQEVSFLANMRYKERLHQSKAGAICIDPTIEKIEGKNYLISDNPSSSFQKIIHAFSNQSLNSTGFKNIHPSSVIHPSCEIGENIEIGPFVSIDQNCRIQSGTKIKAHVSIGPNVSIGENCLIYSNVTIREGCQLHNRVILQPGAVIGSCGYGYETTSLGKHLKIDQIGIVILEDDVEIGANTTIDRARFKATIIHSGTKIDNLVQIGHNVEIGKDNLIVSQTGIAGSTKTGDHVIMGGQCGIVGHIKIASKTVLTTRSGVSKSIDTPAIYGGSPVMPLTEYNRQQVLLRNIEVLNKKIKNLESTLSAMKELLKT
ncbi:MAG: UDP-3-O-(3-hydroxymyristoyl)glucosamine N-acyltransferase [Chlamydiae bacterium]|nr:UDP-3-O-(3-hydroxymyristoyl)glucosamine N-acyltransferase [Chlamydiota bacterium]